MIGKFKDETSSKIITDLQDCERRCTVLKQMKKKIEKSNGILKTVVRNELKFDDYQRSLFGTTKVDVQQKTKFNTTRPYKHELYTISQTKIGLCSFDDK